MHTIKNLRQTVQAAHMALEATDRMKLLMHPNITMAQYTGLLAWWHLHWIQLECLEQQLRPGYPLNMISPLPRADKARRDYEQLYIQQGFPPKTTANQLVEGPHLPSSESSWLGLVYVMRGSELGNRIVHKHLKGCFSETPAAAYLSFFEPTEATLSWPAVLKILDSKMTTQRQMTSVISAAMTVFEWLKESAIQSKYQKKHLDHKWQYASKKGLGDKRDNVITCLADNNHR